MIIDTEKLETELKQALMNCGLPTDSLKITTKHSVDNSKNDFSKFGIFLDTHNILNIQITTSYTVKETTPIE